MNTKNICWPRRYDLMGVAVSATDYQETLDRLFEAAHDLLDPRRALPRHGESQAAPREARETLRLQHRDEGRRRLRDLVRPLSQAGRGSPVASFPRRNG